MKLGKLGRLEVRPASSYIEFVSEPTEINHSEGKEPFKGEIKVQPHFVKKIWEVLEGKRSGIGIRSGNKNLIVIYQKSKSRVRIRFTEGEEKESSYILFGEVLARFKDYFLDVVRKASVVSIQEGEFSASRLSNYIVIRNRIKELTLDKELSDRLKNIIFKNYIIKEPVKMKGRDFTIDDELNLVFRGVIIPKNVVKDLYLFVLV